MNFKETDEILACLKPYLENSDIVISTENEDYRGRKYQSDFVTIDEKSNIGFEVFDNEIIVFYFTEHSHFEDYTSEPEEGQDDYIKRAKDFLLGLFENKIKYTAIYKGKKLSTEKYYIVRPNGENYIGGAWWGFKSLLNPFAEKTVKSTYFVFNKARGVFKKTN